MPKIKGILLSVLTGAVLFGVAAGVYLAVPRGGPAVEISVEPGMAAGKVAAALAEKQVIRFPVVFKALSRLTGLGRKLKPGIYEMTRGAGSLRALWQLQEGRSLRARVTFPEGWTAPQMAELLQTERVLPAQAFLDEVYRLNVEGYLFPSTYLFRHYTPSSEVVGELITEFNRRWGKAEDLAAFQQGLTRHKTVILASIVEREARVDAERPLIAAVFLNRIRKKWKLESCATVQFALGKWKDRLFLKDLEIESPYNTYRHPGLPPGPIGNPGWASIRAVLHPAQTDALFFVSDGNGTHRFSKYYQDHLKAKKRVQKSARKVTPSKKGKR